MPKFWILLAVSLYPRFQRKKKDLAIRAHNIYPRQTPIHESKQHRLRYMLVIVCTHRMVDFSWLAAVCTSVHTAVFLFNVHNCCF